MSTNCYLGIGLHADRLLKNRDNPRERALVKQWQDEHRHHDLLSMLLRVPCDRDHPERVGGGLLGDSLGQYYRYPLGEVTERDRIIAETVIQWLGSNVGLSFLQEAEMKWSQASRRNDDSRECDDEAEMD